MNHIFLHEESIIDSKDQSQNKFLIHRDKILTKFQHSFQRQIFNLVQYEVYVIHLTVRPRHDMHHTKPKVSLHAHFTNAHLAQDI
jgi:hypothetical protein